MHYIVYKITNIINGKFYIGKHQTKDLNDGYLGSGTLIRKAIKKYGKENFEKEILFVFDNEAEMNAKEKELVIISEMSYNLCEGGKGGFSYINRNKLGRGFRTMDPEQRKRYLILAHKRLKDLRNDYSFRVELSKKIRIGLNNNPNNHFLGKHHSDETKRIIGFKNSYRQSGHKNSQYGTIWITDGKVNRKIKKEDVIPAGWYKGRK